MSTGQLSLFGTPDQGPPKDPRPRTFEVYIAPSARLVEAPAGGIGGVAGDRMVRQFGLRPVLKDYASLPDVRRPDGGDAA